MFKSCLILCLITFDVLLSTPLSCQPIFGSAEYISLPLKKLSDFISADLDGDNNIDLISNTTDNGLVWYKNKGKGNFDCKRNINISSNWTAYVYPTDLDNNNTIDLIVSFPNDNNIAWYKNDGKGNFTIKQLINNNNLPNSAIFAADLDNDGDNDLLLDANIDSKIIWYKNNGKENFTLQSTISANNGQTKSAPPIDLDHDGDLDIVSTNYLENKIIYYLNNGKGNFGLAQLVTDKAYEVQSIFVADLDKDGKKDIASCFLNDLVSRYAYHLVWYKNKGNNQFSTQNIIGSQYAYFPISFIDLDNDSDLDLITCSSLGVENEMVWYENKEKGNFANVAVIGSEKFQTNWIATADLDSDGYTDIISDSNIGIIWHKNNQAKKTIKQQNIIASKYPANDLCITDIDNDKDLDIVAVNHHAIIWYENDCNGIFMPAKLICQTTAVAQDIQSADLDNDKDQDIVTIVTSDNKTEVLWYKNEGKGNFTKQTTIYNNYFGGSILLLNDFDKDGYIDILTNIFQTKNDTAVKINQLLWFKNKHKGNFEENKIIDNLPDQLHILIDVDTDGDIDILNMISHQWYENTGKGKFIKKSWYLDRDANTTYMVDLDHDGKKDILQSERYGLCWYKNKGENNFEQKYLGDEANQIGANLQVADLDNDNDTDIVSISGCPSSITYFRNDKKDNFTVQQNINQISLTNTACLADLNNDQYLDLILFGGSQSDILWFKNLLGTAK